MDPLHAAGLYPTGEDPYIGVNGPGPAGTFKGNRSPAMFPPRQLLASPFAIKERK